MGAGWGDGWFDVREEVGWGRVGSDALGNMISGKTAFWRHVMGFTFKMA